MFSIIALIGFIYAFTLLNRVQKSGQLDVPLTKDEKTKVIISEIVSPILAGAVYYYGWRHTYPQKAKEANRYSWLILLAEVVIVLIASVLFHAIAG